MIAVIADDITGAAEMGGIAFRLGLNVQLSMQPDCAASDADVFVIASDTRSMNEADAASESARIAAALDACPKVKSIFKKTDSALRGHVVAELASILSCTRYTDALYIPANPSKGRTIREGNYYVGSTPLHQTDFSFDPEFPATSSSLAVRFPDARERGIRYADAVTDADIREAVVSASPDTLLAGAADLFTEYLRHTLPCRETAHPKPCIDLADALIICGSTQSKVIDCGIPVSYMPTPLYDGKAGIDSWLDEIAADYAAFHRLILSMRDRHRTGREAAVYLRETMAETVSRLIDPHRPAELIIEGGATAYAILRHLGWDTFTITDEIAPGVIRMKAPTGTSITMKPGSYPWGNLF